MVKMIMALSVYDHESDRSGKVEGNPGASALRHSGRKVEVAHERFVTDGG